LDTDKHSQGPREEDYLSHIAFDSVIFGFNGKDLKILVMQYHNTGLYALPGGFVRRNESLNQAVTKGVVERTGIDHIYLEQFQTFGGLDRFDSNAMERILEMNGLNPKDHEWLLDRFISIAYYALINFEEVNAVPDALADSIDWYSFEELPPLMMDHGEIVQKAFETLRANLDGKLLGMNLLPEKFTMRELQSVYENIMGESFKRTAFQRKMLATNALIRHEKRFTGGAHRAPYLYSFKTHLQKTIG